MSQIFVKGKELIKEHKDLNEFIKINFNAHIKKNNLVKIIGLHSLLNKEDISWLYNIIIKVRKNHKCIFFTAQN